MHCPLSDHATISISGGRSTWLLCRLYVFCWHNWLLLLSFLISFLFWSYCTLSEVLASKRDPLVAPVKAPWHNTPLIHLLILVQYILFACLLSFPTYFIFSFVFFLTYLFPYLPFPLRIGPLSFQAGGHKRRPNLQTWVSVYFEL